MSLKVSFTSQCEKLRRRKWEDFLIIFTLHVCTSPLRNPQKTVSHLIWLSPWSTLVEWDEQPYWPHWQATKSMKVKKIVSAVSGLFLKLIYYGASMVVHLLQLKFSMALIIASFEGPWRPAASRSRSASRPKSRWPSCHSTRSVRARRTSRSASAWRRCRGRRRWSSSRSSRCRSRILPAMTNQG